MKEYINKKTGAIIHSTCVIFGGDWEEVKKDKNKEEVKKDKNK